MLQESLREALEDKAALVETLQQDLRAGRERESALQMLLVSLLIESFLDCAVSFRRGCKL